MLSGSACLQNRTISKRMDRPLRCKERSGHPNPTPSILRKAHPPVQWPPSLPTKSNNEASVETDHDECLEEWNVVDNGDLLIFVAVAALDPRTKVCRLVGKNSALGFTVHVTHFFDLASRYERIQAYSSLV
jgi:hypothetical protein